MLFNPTRSLSFAIRKLWCVILGVILIIALIIIEQAVIFGFKIDVPPNSTLSKILLALPILFSGVLLFGFSAMGLTLPRRSLPHCLTVLIPLLSSYVLNGLGNAITNWRFENLNVPYVFATALWEEALFRAFLLYSCHLLFGFKRPYIRLLSVIICGYIFALAHGSDPREVFFRTALGIMLGMVYLSTESLVFVVFAHAFNNALTDIAGANTDPQFQILLFLAMTALSLLIVYQQKRNYTPQFRMLKLPCWKPLFLT
jgi:membrane protease YdiL (CAAX protease family)